MLHQSCLMNWGVGGKELKHKAKSAPLKKKKQFFSNNSDFERVIEFVVPVIVCSCLVCVVFIWNISHRSWWELNEGIAFAAVSVSCVGVEKGHNAVFANVMHATWFPWTISGGFVPRDDKLAHTTAQCRIIPVTSHNYITV